MIRYGSRKNFLTNNFRIGLRKGGHPASDLIPNRRFIDGQGVSNQAIQRFTQTCPRALPSPRLCPFGGACRACPARVQAKLTVSQPNDPYEQEADRVAEQVMSMPEPPARVPWAGQECRMSEKVQTTMTGQSPVIQRQTGPHIPPSKRAQRIFLWMETPLRLAVGNAGKIDQWNDDQVSGLILLYNKMRNEDVWKYVDGIKDASSRVAVDFFPIGSPVSLRGCLPSHQYINCLASYKLDWGLRKEKACGPHLHFKHFKPSDNWVHVHIDKIDPCCGYVPIIGVLVSMLRHYHHDVKGWTKRNPQQFIKLLQRQGVPLSQGILNFISAKGYI
jgi:hypothetical protein